MNADDFRDYMLSFLFLRYLSDNYETAAKKELGRDYPKSKGGRPPRAAGALVCQQPERRGRVRKADAPQGALRHQAEHLWASIANLARTQNGELLNTCKRASNTSKRILREHLPGPVLRDQPRLGQAGRTYADRNAKLCTIIQKIAEGLNEFSTDIDTLGDAYEYLIGQFAAGSGKKAGEFYTPQQISEHPVRHRHAGQPGAEDRQESKLASVLDFACGSGSLLLNVRKRMGRTASARFTGRKRTSPPTTWRA
jgi:type I restriction enzyme M protein